MARAGYGPSELAARAGVSAVSVANWSRGYKSVGAGQDPIEVRPSDAAMARMARALSIPRDMVAEVQPGAALLMEGPVSHAEVLAQCSLDELLAEIARRFAELEAGS